MCLCAYTENLGELVYQQLFLVEINTDNSFVEGSEWVNELSCLTSNINILNLFLSEI